MGGLFLLGISLVIALATATLRPKKVSAAPIIEPPPAEKPPDDPIVIEPDPIEKPAIPYVGNTRVLRVFVLDTTDKPISARGRAVIEENYREAVYWVNREMGFGIRYRSYIQYFSLPYTSADIRSIVLGAYPRPKEAGTDAWALFHFITDWMAENTQWDTYGGGVINESWLFMVRGAGGFAGGVDPAPDRPGLAIVGDAVLSAWLGDAGLEVNDAYKVVFLDDRSGRAEWEIGYDGIPALNEYSRRHYTTRNAQIGSFIHEGFHAMFAMYHLGDFPQFQATGAPSNIMDNWQDYPFPEDKRMNEDGVYEEPIHAIVRADALESFFV